MSELERTNKLQPGRAYKGRPKNIIFPAAPLGDAPADQAQQRVDLPCGSPDVLLRNDANSGRRDGGKKCPFPAALRSILLIETPQSVDQRCVEDAVRVVVLRFGQRIVLLMESAKAHSLVQMNKCWGHSGWTSKLCAPSMVRFAMSAGPNDEIVLVGGSITVEHDKVKRN